MIPMIDAEELASQADALCRAGEWSAAQEQLRRAIPTLEERAESAGSRSEREVVEAQLRTLSRMLFFAGKSAQQARRADAPTGRRLVIDLSYARGYGTKAAVSVAKQVSALYGCCQRMADPFALELCAVEGDIEGALLKAGLREWRVSWTGASVDQHIDPALPVVRVPLQGGGGGGGGGGGTASAWRVLEPFGEDADRILVVCGRQAARGAEHARLPVAEYVLAHRPPDMPPADEAAAAWAPPTLMLHTAVGALARYVETRCWVQALASSIPHNAQRRVM